MPLIDLPVNLKIGSEKPVNVGQIVLAADGGSLKAIRMPETVAEFSAASDEIRGSGAGISLRTVVKRADRQGVDLEKGWMERVGLPTGPDPETAPVSFGDMEMQTYGLTLDKGIVLRGLDIDLGLRELHC